MKSLIPMTYYQLMHSIALALTFDEKPNLYFSMEFLNPSEKLIQRIKETGIFNVVRGITKKGDFYDIRRALRKTRGVSDEEIDRIGTSLFEKYLEPHYAEELKDADTKDEIYIYNDFQWHYYYICKHFENIIGVEDGYGSLLQQIGIHRFRGDKVLLIPFIERGYYPEPLYKHKKISRIISSTYFDELDDYYKDKLVVWDYKEIVAQNETEFKKALLHIFDVNSLGITSNSSLYLGQPLDRSKYCNAIENYLLCKKIIKSEIDKGYYVYYKPHPAERNDPRVYGNDGTKVLPKDFPVEVFNYQEKKFDRLVTFGSTGASIATCAKEQKIYFSKTEFTREDVTLFIKDQISNEKIVFDFYIKIREMTPEAYINAYSCIFRNRNIHTNLHFLILKGEKENSFINYYDKSNLKKRALDYKKQLKGSKERLLWHKELSWIKNWISRYNPSITFNTLESFDDKKVFEEVISRNNDYDYLMLLDSGNPGFMLTEIIAKSLKTRIYPAIFFSLHTIVDDEHNRSIKISLNPGVVGNHYNGDIINKVWHREVVRRVMQNEYSPTEFGRIVREYDEYIRKIADISLYVSPAKYLDIKDGDSYFVNKAREIIERNNTIDQDNDHILGQFAHVVYDYYDWRSVVDGSAFSTQISDAVNIIIKDYDYQFEVYKLFADAMLIERAASNNIELFQEHSYYQTIRPIVDKAAEVGVLSGVDNLSRIKNKVIRNKK